jgi:spermidine synthase
MAHGSGFLVHKDSWNGHGVEVKDNGDYRSLYFGHDHLQSRLSLSHPETLALSYTRYMAAALLLLPQPQDILIIGVGGGSLIHFFSHHFRDCRIDAVDFSQHILHIARGYFKLPENDRIILHCLDGLQFLQSAACRSYDLILIDAYDHEGMAPEIYCREFFARCRTILKDQGVVSCNLWSSDALCFQQIRTILTESFSECLYLPVPERGNIVALAMQRSVPWSRFFARKKEFDKLRQRFDIDFKTIAETAKANNLGLAERFLSFLKGAGGGK